ncbi:hypothetical protein SAMN04487894_11440 [Niabella drilacis]|uniref:Uncharacterized protein n=1 Tax=Niabella drilacis (strain DSM 25811 / CCM 8410 / CCUG 62505 / LMG 26954 / E90) TaxID=1285928 RepID=A0A1G6XY42_NIADE|nr:hypothetical protein SAMN04487894_11440 [Niabella drilacis]
MPAYYKYIIQYLIDHHVRKKFVFHKVATTIQNTNFYNITAGRGYWGHSGLTQTKYAFMIGYERIAQYSPPGGYCAVFYTIGINFLH